MLRDNVVPLSDDSPGCRLGDRARSIQNGSNTYNVSLNRDYLALLNILEQGAMTKHAVALRPVEIKRPAYIIQPVEVLDE